MLVAQDVQEMDSILDALVKYVHFRNWTLYSIKILRPATFENILEVQS